MQQKFCVLSFSLLLILTAQAALGASMPFFSFNSVTIPSDQNTVSIDLNFKTDSEYPVEGLTVTGIIASTFSGDIVDFQLLSVNFGMLPSGWIPTTVLEDENFGATDYVYPGNPITGELNPFAILTLQFTDDVFKAHGKIRIGFDFLEAADPKGKAYTLTSDNFAAGEISVSSTPVPVPASMLLLGSGLVGLAGFRRKRSGKQV